MKTSQVFIISAIVISSTFFGILSVFELPQSAMEWIVSDVILGIILYLSYLVIAMVSGASRPKVHYRAKKVTV